MADIEAEVSADDLAAMSRQLGRDVRGVIAVAHRCSCGEPDVVKTSPRLPDGTPFPTLYYITCPRLAAQIGTLEADGMMREFEQRLADDANLATGYRKAHEQYLRDREAVRSVAEIAGISAGGMPDRVKCLHVLVGHALAGGAGVNPIGDAALAMLDDWGKRPCRTGGAE